MAINDEIAESANEDEGHHIRLLSARVTFLEMETPLKKSFPLPTSPRTALIAAENIPASFFRFLFQQVGKPHHWEGLRNMDDVDLDNYLNSDHVDLCVLYCDGCPAGFFLLELDKLPELIELSLFGLMPEYQGLALGKWFLASAINAAWQHEPGKVSVNTNSLDHPAALHLYQKLGFSPVGYKEVAIEAWE